MERVKMRTMGPKKAASALRCLVECSALYAAEPEECL